MPGWARQRRRSTRGCASTRRSCSRPACPRPHKTPAHHHIGPTQSLYRWSPSSTIYIPLSHPFSEIFVCGSNLLPDGHFGLDGVDRIGSRLECLLAMGRRDRNRHRGLTHGTHTQPVLNRHVHHLPATADLRTSLGKGGDQRGAGVQGPRRQEPLGQNISLLIYDLLTCVQISRRTFSAMGI